MTDSKSSLRAVMIRSWMPVCWYASRIDAAVIAVGLNRQDRQPTGFDVDVDQREGRYCVVVPREYLEFAMARVWRPWNLGGTLSA